MTGLQQEQPQASQVCKQPLGTDPGMSMLPSLACLCPNPQQAALRHGMAAGLGRVTPGRNNASLPCEAGARRDTKNIPPSPLPTCALFSLHCPCCPHQSPLDCQCIIASPGGTAGWGSAAVASDPSMTGRVRLLNESKRTDVPEYQTYKGNPIAPHRCGVRCCDH